PSTSLAPSAGSTSPPRDPPLALTSLGAVSDAPACPPQAPLWFVYAHNQMTQQNLGAHYNALLAAWARIEAASRFESSGTISKQFRPEQVNRWIQYGRGRNGRPDTTITNPTQYEHQWWTWWGALQPGWR
ncbi:hypothetical protein B0H16DRAFT_1263707, partial [Mycena metata]